MRILIIEDNPLKLNEIKKHILENGVNEKLVLTAKSINSALCNLEKVCFDLIIVDMELPQDDDDYEKDSQGGISILECIKESIHNNSNDFKIPKSILVLTQFQDLISQYEAELKICRIIPTLYEHGSDDWKNDITSEVEKAKILIAQHEPVDFDSNVVVTIHGIRTYGDWQSKLESLIDDEYIVKSYAYNFHSAIDFFSEKSSQEEIHLFNRCLDNIQEQYPLAKIHIVSHSFGTYIAFHALLNRSTRLDIGNVIFSGSVLKPEQDIDSLYKKHNIDKVVNDCSLIDFPLLLAQLFSNRYSLAGIIGFKGDKNRIINRRFSGGHSTYFSESHLDTWKLILCSDIYECTQKKYDGFCMDLYYGLIAKKPRFRLLTATVVVGLIMTFVQFI
ncbi:hypothetical protein ACT0GK_003207 [Vibrio parahaemolyticus]